MGETSDQIAKHIRETRTDLSENINELEDKVKTAMDWRVQFEEHPGAVLGAAFVGGALLSAIIPTMRGSHSGPRDGDWSTSETRAAAHNRQTVTSETKKPSETFRAVKIALIGLGANRLINYVNELLPGFEQEFSRARTGQRSPDWAR
jgi:hypothetical protein